MNRSIIDAYSIFPFAIVLALALGEAFKTVATEENFVYWDRLPSLASFLLLILPFYQGMNKYLLLNYGAGVQAPAHYARFVLIDGASFMGEAALFFVMSRTLAMNHWRRFYSVVTLLLVLDCVWGRSVQSHATPQDAQVIAGWISLNIKTIAGLLIMIGVGCWRPGNDILPMAIGPIGMFIRTYFDYVNSWDFYFPSS
jgi:hypothetical protein